MIPLLLGVSLVCAQARTFYTLPSSNGHGAIVADTQAAKLVHFRERLPATEEPQLDAAGNVVVQGTARLDVLTRDLLYDAYFGVRTGGTQRWLSGLAVTLSAYENGIVTWVQQSQGLTLTTYAFAPRSLPHAGFVMLLHIEGAGATAAFTLHNYSLGFGRPLPQSNGETLTFAANHDVLERGFAGVVVTRPLGTVSHALGWNDASGPAANGFAIVQGTTNDLGDSTGELAVATDCASAVQYAVTGSDTWLGVVVAHSGDPFAATTVQGWLDAYVNGRTAQALLDDERAGWAAFQATLTLPSGLSADEEKVARQSAVLLSMAQVKETSAYLREWLTRDGEPRRSAFATMLPATVTHRGAGALLASLPPGEWTYAWVRDGAYAAAALAQVGRGDDARAAVRFVLDAAALPSLTRYTGFGVPEQDWNDFGPNVEYDGYGLTLWAMRKAQLDDVPKARAIASEILSLVDPATGLMKRDSSIWETHTQGRERTWTYTNITAVRGLCDAAALDPERGDAYRAAALALRRQIAGQLTDSSGALASNLEELKAGSGYADAAVLDAFELGLFRRDGRIATATVKLLDEKLKATAGPGWSRNDDRTDTNGLSDWGSEYDSAEWVFTDLRGSRLKATRAWTTAQAAANAGVIPETYDEQTGAWKFNAPMIGFGAGAYLLSLLPPEGPACGVYFEDEAAAPDGGTSGSDAGTEPMQPPKKGCGCAASPGVAVALVALLAGRAERRRSRPSTGSGLSALHPSVAVG